MLKEIDSRVSSVHAGIDSVRAGHSDWLFAVLVGRDVSGAIKAAGSLGKDCVELPMILQVALASPSNDGA